MIVRGWYIGAKSAEGMAMGNKERFAGDPEAAAARGQLHAREMVRRLVTGAAQGRGRWSGFASDP